MSIYSSIKKIVISSCCIYSFLVFAEKAQPELNQSIDILLTKIAHNQIKKHKINRYKGTWPYKVSSPKIPGFSISETNLFLPLQMMVALSGNYKFSDVAQKNIQSMKVKLNQQINLYLQDVAQSPVGIKGSVNYWPYLQLNNGQMTHFFSRSSVMHKLIIEKTMGISMLPNDTDDSSRLYLYSLLNKNSLGQGLYPEYEKVFLKELENYLDINRPDIDSTEMAWKNVNSGGFLTWYIKKDESDLSNDMDCVVNANVLASLNAAESIGSVTLSPTLKKAQINTCNLLGKLIYSPKKVKRCSLYYERPTQLYLAMAKAMQLSKNKFNCTHNYKDQLSKVLMKRATQMTLDPSKQLRPLETAELKTSLSIINSFYPAENYQEKLNELNKLLLKYIKTETIKTSSSYSPWRLRDFLRNKISGPKKESVHMGANFFWYSKDYVNAYVIEAIQSE